MNLLQWHLNSCREFLSTVLLKMQEVGDKKFMQRKKNNSGGEGGEIWKSKEGVKKGRK